jgi:hypothetical protein
MKPSMRVFSACAFVIALSISGVSISQAAVIDPTPVFSDPLNITNPYQPFVPGGMKVFSGRKSGERSVIVDLYLQDTRTFQLDGSSVACHILQETEFEGGVLSEISLNYFAQADDGGVYYFGETVDSYEDGVIVDHEGSWLVGGPTDPSDPPETATATTPGLFMPADPQVGDSFKPEDLYPIVDETGTVEHTGRIVTVPAGRFEDCIEVVETTQLGDPPETKWYAPGVGVIRGHTRSESFALEASTLTGD